MAGPGIDDSASLNIGGSVIGGSLMQLLMADDIAPGSDPGYELCKIIYLYHPLGRKMTQTPISIAQSQARERVVQDAPNEVMEAFDREWRELKADDVISNTMLLARIYGIGSVAMIVDGENAGTPTDPTTWWRKQISFNVFDPLNTAGSLVLNQVPTARDFNKPVSVRVNGVVYHPTRFEVIMNEVPIYLAYTGSAFGFVGRSVYQRALFPLKSFVRSMIADDMVAMKLGLLVAKRKAPGSTIDNVMLKVFNIGRAILKMAQTGQVLNIGVEDSIETLNMQNVDGAGNYSRTNIIKNIASAAEMPAKLVDNETLVSGFGEGTEDAKNIAKYVDGVRKDMDCLYAFFEKVCMYRAWNPELYKRVQAKYPEQWRGRSFTDAFSEWRNNYSAKWPSLLTEPASEAVKVDQIRAESTIALVQTLAPQLDPENKAVLIQWAADTLAENKQLFPHELNLDMDALQAYAEEHADDAAAAAAGAGGEDTGVAKKLGKFG